MFNSAMPRFLKQTNINLTYRDKPISSKIQIYLNKNRYFVSLRGFISELGGKVERFGKNCYVNLKKKEVIVLDLDYMRFTEINNTIYISLFDIVDALNLTTIWDYKNNVINIKELKNEKINSMIKTGDNKALIRLEDFTNGSDYESEDNLFKTMIVFDYLYNNNIPFHIAWIPRFIDPENGIDRDLVKEQNIERAYFIYTLDYALSRGAIIGIHGYTHQYGNEVSGEGTEFDENTNNKEEQIVEKLKKAIETANYLEIDTKFFESPHYASSEYQQSIMERYFNYIYEPCVGIWGDKVVLSPRNKRTLYIPTPLSYLEDEDIDGMLNRIEDLPENIIASFFYHVYKEFNFISVDKEIPEVIVKYSEDSYLKRILEAIINKDRLFTYIAELKHGD